MIWKNLNGNRETSYKVLKIDRSGVLHEYNLSVPKQYIIIPIRENDKKTTLSIDHITYVKA